MQSACVLVPYFFSMPLSSSARLSSISFGRESSFPCELFQSSREVNDSTLREFSPVLIRLSGTTDWSSKVSLWVDFFFVYSVMIAVVWYRNMNKFQLLICRWGSSDLFEIRTMTHLLLPGENLFIYRLTFTRVFDLNSVFGSWRGVCWLWFACEDDSGNFNYERTLFVIVICTEALFSSRSYVSSKFRKCFSHHIDKVDGF